MDKILNLKKALEEIGVKTDLYLELEQYCMDGKIHKGIELETNMFNGEEYVSFVFHPTTYKLVDSYLDCPIVKEWRK